MTSKQDLRRLFRQRRQEQLSLGSVICRQVQTLVQASPVRTGHLGLYWPLNGEVDLRTIRLAISNEVALPFADGCGGLHYRHWTDTPLQADGCGIPLPTTDSPCLPTSSASCSSRRWPSIEPASAWATAAVTTTGCGLIPLGIRAGLGGASLRLHQFEPLPRDAWDVPFTGWITEHGPGQPR